MGAYTVTYNGTISIDLSDDYRDNGWAITNGVAKHSSCNAGFIKLNSFPFKVGVPNVFKYVVSNYSSGNININVGSQSGANTNSNGIKQITITPTSANDVITFFADGNVWVELLEVYTQTTETTGIALYFNEPSDKWVMYSSIRPEFMLKFINSFYSWKDGTLWEHHVNPLHNNFYGVQYTSKIIFYVNLNPTAVKSFFSMRQKSNSLWTASNEGDILLFPSEGKPNGQVSRLKASRFKRLQTDYFADFLRDMNDPRFVDKQQALLKGAQLQGNVMQITLENDSTDKVRLLSIDITIENSNYTY